MSSRLPFFRRRPAPSPADVPIREAVTEDWFWGRINTSGSEEDYYWRRLSDNWAHKDLLPSVYLDLHNQVYEAYNANPLANAIIEMGVNFVLGDGLTLDAKHPKVQKLLDDFWSDPDNRMNLRQYDLALELSLYGELFIRFFVNKYSGKVKIAQIDPILIDDIVCDPDNIERQLRCHRRATSVTGTTDTIPVPTDPGMKDEWFSMPDEVMHFAVNKVTNAKRGKSDLATLLPWLRRYKDWLIDRVRINKYKAAFLWDVTLQGADKRTIDSKMMELSRPPEPGSVLVHNESESWQAVQPAIAGDDVASDGQAIKLMVAVGAGLPEHYLSEGGDVNRACYSADTETLTESGWKRYDEIGEEERIATYNPETGSIEYHRPTSWHVYPYEGEMLHFKTKGVDVLVTPDHDMWVQIPPNNSRTRKPAHTPWEKRKAEALTRTPAFRFLVATRYHGEDVATFTLPGSIRRSRGDQPERLIPMDLWLEFLGYMVSEGCIYTGRTSTGGASYKLNLSQKNEAHASRIASVLARLPFAFAHHLSADRTHRWQVADKALWSWLRENVGGKAATKRLPRFIRTLSERQQRILFEALMLGDGTDDARDGRTCRAYTTSSPGLADDVQELAMRLGMRTSRAGGTRCLRVLCSGVPYRDVRFNRVSRVPYSGVVYCFHVENHLFVTRRNGAVAIHGNTASEMGLPVLKKYQRRQDYLGYIFRAILDRVIAEAERAGTLPRTIDKSYAIRFPPLQATGAESQGLAAYRMAQALQMARSLGLVSVETASQLFFDACREDTVDAKSEVAQARAGDASISS